MGILDLVWQTITTHSFTACELEGNLSNLRIYLTCCLSSLVFNWRILFFVLSGRWRTYYCVRLLLKTGHKLTKRGQITDKIRLFVSKNGKKIKLPRQSVYLSKQRWKRTSDYWGSAPRQRGPDCRCQELQRQAWAAEIAGAGPITMTWKLNFAKCHTVFMLDLYSHACYAATTRGSDGTHRSQNILGRFLYLAGCINHKFSDNRRTQQLVRHFESALCLIECERCRQGRVCKPQKSIWIHRQHALSSNS